jgi:hypothetical protein
MDYTIDGLPSVFNCSLNSLTKLLPEFRIPAKNAGKQSHPVQTSRRCIMVNAELVRRRVERWKSSSSTRCGCVHISWLNLAELDSLSVENTG